VKHQQVKDVAMTIECEQDYGVDSAQISPSTGAKNAIVEAQYELMIECQQLVGIDANRACNPIAAMFIQYESNGPFIYTDQTEWQKETQHPLFSQPLRIPINPTAALTPSTMLQLAVYDVESEEVRNEDKVGSVTISYGELIEKLNQQLHLPLTDEDQQRGQLLADNRSMMILSIQPILEAQPTNTDPILSTSQHQPQQPSISASSVDSAVDSPPSTRSLSSSSKSRYINTDPTSQLILKKVFGFESLPEDDEIDEAFADLDDLDHLQF